MYMYTSRFWVENLAWKHRKKMSFDLAKPYGPGLKIDCAKKNDIFSRCFQAGFSTHHLDMDLTTHAQDVIKQGFSELVFEPTPPG